MLLNRDRIRLLLAVLYVVVVAVGWVASMASVRSGSDISLAGRPEVYPSPMHTHSHPRDAGDFWGKRQFKVGLDCSSTRSMYITV